MVTIYSFSLYFESSYAHISYTLCCCCCLVIKLCPTLCNPVDSSPPGSSVHGIFQARILESVAISFSKGFSQPRDWTRISWIGKWIYHWATWEKPLIHYSVGQIGNQKTPSSSFSSFSRVLIMFQVLKNTRTIKTSYTILPILDKKLIWITNLYWFQYHLSIHQNSYQYSSKVWIAKLTTWLVMTILTHKNQTLTF